MEFGILGPLEVRDGGRRIEIGGKRERVVLALLLLHANELVTSDQLLDALYGEHPPRTARTSLQNAVSRLRKLLGPDVPATEPGGYVLRLDPGRLDLTNFERLAEQADTADAETRSRLLRDALALWRGELLADLAYEPFVEDEANLLAERKRAVLEQRLEADLELGRFAEAIPELEALCREHRYVERPRMMLMRALYYSDRRVDALKVYDGAVRALKEIGVGPSQALQDLTRSMLAQDLPAPEVGAARPPPVFREGRRTVTVLRCDVVGSTGIAERLDPEQYRAVLKRYFDLASAVVEQHGGTMEKFIGDAVMALFGTPRLHEDDALRAITAAVRIRDALPALNDQLASWGVRIELRFGVNTGEVAVGDPSAGGALATGDMMNVVARLEEAAATGELVLGDLTYRLAAGSVQVEPLEPLVVEGRAVPVRAWRFVSLQPEKPVFEGFELVGREDELAELERAFADAVEAKRCRMAVVLGDAGLGKSRLARELVERLRGTADAVGGQCLAYGEGTTYWPVAEIVRSLTSGAPPEEGLRTLLADERDGDVLARSVAAALGLVEGGSDPSETLLSVRRLLEAVARRRPLLVVLDDVHWAEPALLDLAEYVAAFAEGPMLLLCLARPDLLDERPAWSAPAPGGAVLKLAPLGADDAGTLLGHRLGERELPDEARGRMIDAAEGNPLFLEQLLALSLEAGVPAELAIPERIQLLLAARIDALAGDERAVLERAAVEGASFHRGSVVALLPQAEREKVDSLLLGLVRRELVRPGRSSFPDEHGYRFAHALVREAAYDGLSKALRGELHAGCADWLEQRAGPRLTEFEELLGYHLEWAYRYRAELTPADGENAILAERAAERLGNSGLRALRRGDARAAANLLGRATELPTENGRRPELLVELGIARQLIGDTQAAESVFATVAGARGERGVRVRAELELAWLRLRADPRRSGDDLLASARKAIPILERGGADRSLGRAWLAIGYVEGQCRGRCSVWEEATAKALDHYERAGWTLSVGLGDLAGAAYFGPRPAADAIDACNELLERARSTVEEANVLRYLGALESLRGEVDRGRALVERSRASFELLGAGAVATGLAVQGHVERLAGRYADALPLLDESVRTLSEKGSTVQGFAACELAACLYCLQRYEDAGIALPDEGSVSSDDVMTRASLASLSAQLRARRGDDDARALAESALALAETTDMVVFRAELSVAEAEVLGLLGAPAEAALSLERAIEGFDRKGAIPLAARARKLHAATLAGRAQRKTPRRASSTR